MKPIIVKIKTIGKPFKLAPDSIIHDIMRIQAENHERLTEMISEEAERLDEEIMRGIPQRAEGGEVMPVGSTKPPVELQPNDKYWLVFPDPFNSQRWSADEGNSYRGEIFRIKTCCGKHGRMYMKENHPDIMVIMLVEESPEQLAQVPFMYQIVEA